MNDTSNICPYCKQDLTPIFKYFGNDGIAYHIQLHKVHEERILRKFIEYLLNTDEYGYKNKCRAVLNGDYSFMEEL